MILLLSDEKNTRMHQIINYITTEVARKKLMFFKVCQTLKKKQYIVEQLFQNLSMFIITGKAVPILQRKLDSRSVNAIVFSLAFVRE